MISTKDLVLQALQRGLMVHGCGGAVKDKGYETVYSVMISATTKTKVLVYAASTNADHEEALRDALHKALERANSNVKAIK